MVGEVIDEGFVAEELGAEAAVEAWLIAERAAGRGATTLDAYERHLRAALCEMAASAGVSLSELPLAAITRQRVRAHLAAYRTQPDRRFADASAAARERSPASVRTRLHALRALSRWAVAEGMLQADATAGLRVQVPAPAPPVPLSEEEARALLELTRARTGGRDHLVCALLLGLGLRVGEVATLECADVRGGRIRVRGQSPREVQITPLVAAALAAYAPARARLARRLGYTGDALVLGRSGPFTADGLGKLVARSMARAGLEGDAHRLRASFAALALGAGVEVSAVRQAAGVSLTALRRLAGGDAAPRSLAAHPLSASL